jgi:cytochrome P450
LWRYVKLFRRDLLSAQPAKLYRAWMAEFKTPFFRSYLINQPELVDLVLKRRPRDFPKSNRVSEGLRPLLGNSVFSTNGAEWERQRRIIDPAFEGGRLREAYPAIAAAAEAAVARLAPKAGGGPVEIEAETSFSAADVIFRTLFSIPIEDRMARQVFEEFKTYQRSQPVVNLAAFFRLPKWMPRPFARRTRRSAAVIRRLISDLTDKRAEALAAGTAPNDLASKIMTTKDPITGLRFTRLRWWIRSRFSFWPGMRPVHLPCPGRFTSWRCIQTIKKRWPAREPLWDRRHNLRICGRCASPATCFVKLCAYIRRCR